VLRKVLGKQLQFIPQIRQFISTKIDFPAAEVQAEWQAVVEGRGAGKMAQLRIFDAAHVKRSNNSIS